MPSKKRRSPASASTALAVSAPVAASLVSLELVVDRARDFAAASRSPPTRAAYASEWATFEEWCEQKGLQALPCTPLTLACFLSERADGGIRPSSLGVAIAAIAAAHRSAGIPTEALPNRHPQTQQVWAGIRRTKGVAPRRAAAVMVDDLRAMSETLGSSLIDTRDRALLVVGFAGAFRRSELAELDYASALAKSDPAALAKTDPPRDRDLRGPRRSLISADGMRAPRTAAWPARRRAGDRVGGYGA